MNEELNTPAEDYATAAAIWTVIGVGVVSAFIYDAVKKDRKRKKRR